MSAFRTAVLVTMAVAAATSPDPALAQDVQYETVTKIDFAGGLGTAMRLAARLGGGSMESVETNYIKGRRMRTDSDRNSTIMDLESGRVTLLDHDAKTYTTFTFQEMMDRARQSSGGAADDRREQMGQGGTEAAINFRFSVDQANQRDRIAGYDAERFFLTLEVEAEAVPNAQNQAEHAGTLVVLTDMWTSREIPVLQARSAFEDATARQYADASAALTEGFAAAFADDPRFRVAFEQSMNEARKMEGMAVRTVTSFVTVAPGKRFDRAPLTDPKPAGPTIAQQAGRAALSGVMGRLGRRGAEAQPAAEPEATQATIMSITSELRNVATRSLEDSLFEVPAGYSERQM